MINLRKILNELLDEAPIDNLSTIGFDKDDSGKIKKGSFTRDKRDVEIVTHSNFLNNVRNFFDRTDETFDFYIINGKGLSKFRELGKVDEQFILNKDGLNLSKEQLKNAGFDEDAITVFFVSTAGAEKVPFTPWTMAHRFGHAIKNEHQFEEYVKHFENIIISILRENYGIDIKTNYGRISDDKLLAKIYNQLGTMRSARLNKINRYFEFYYELFAQYLNTGGNVKLNKLPKQLIIGTGSYGRKEYAYFKGSDEQYQDMCDLIESLERDINIWMIGDVLGSIIGNIYVM